MHKKEEVLQALLAHKLLPLYYHDSEETTLGVLDALYKGGVRLVEYTNRGAAALDNFRAMRARVDQSLPGMLLGIGTIKTVEAAKDFMDAGADFIVCPAVNPAVGTAVQEAGLLWIPGCLTPTEIATAEAAGAQLVKIFPGNILGPGYVNAIRDIFPGLHFMPTGGVEVTQANLSAWFSAGVAAVGMGSKLITADALQRKAYDAISGTAAAALAMIKEVVENH